MEPSRNLTFEERDEFSREDRASDWQKAKSPFL